MNLKVLFVLDSNYHRFSSNRIFCRRPLPGHGPILLHTVRPGRGLFQSNNVLNCQRRTEKGKHIPRFTRTRSDMVKDKAAVAGSYTEARFSGNNASAMGAVLVHLLCGLGLGIAVWFAQSVESISLVSDPVHTLRLISAIQCPIVILLFSRYRRNPETCSYLKAVVRGALVLPVGALVNALGAIALGAPVGTQYLWRTIQWSCMMSAFTFVPAGSVFGSSWSDWQRIFAYTKPVCFIDYMICLPAHGAIIGAWFGAWPMPLDWERPWQDWPICVSYGAILGYVLGMLASIGFILHHKRRQRIKVD